MMITMNHYVNIIILSLLLTLFSVTILLVRTSACSRDLIADEAGGVPKNYRPLSLLCVP